MSTIVVVFICTIENYGENCRRQNRFTEHHQFKGFDKGITGCDLDEVGVGSRPKSRDYLTRLIVIGQYGDTRCRMLLLEQLDLSNSRVQVIAAIDHKQARLVPPQR